jgi:16S rRNA (adenine1518-N6/adenine1519-N6)-dimethyltransferase
VREAGIRPAKALGQHFLTDHAIAGRIVGAAELTSDDVVVEVGPGLGVLTERLAAVAGRVIAVELDARLAHRLRGNLTETQNVTVIESDILELTPRQVLEAGGVSSTSAYVVVANLPYNIGAAVLRHFLEAEQAPARLVVMLQREVVEAIVAKPGDLGLLGVATQVYAEARRLFNVPPRAFYPPPRVTSGVVRLDVRTEPLVPPSARDQFFAVVRAGFSAPRKQLRNSLANGLQRPVGAVAPAIEAAGVDGTRRPEDLSIEEWLRLSREVEMGGSAA